VIATDARNAGHEQRWFLAPRPDAKAVSIPSIIQETYPAYHGVVWYWRRIEVAPHPYVNGRYLLRFNAVDYLSEVWLNGVQVGGHEGGETPFTLDITSSVRPGKDNLLAVRVLNPSDERIDGIVLAETAHRNKFVEYTNGALPDFGGIVEPVELLLAPAIRITDIDLRPDWQTGVVPVNVTLHSGLGKNSKARLHFLVTAASIREAVLTDFLNVEIVPGENQLSHQVVITNHRLWDVVDPYLYRLSVSVEADGVEGVHETSARFGFREFRVMNGYFRLNGRRIFVKSTHTGNHCPYRVTSPPPGYRNMLRKDMLYAKASGFNMVRFISGVAHPYELDLCDELGLMVYEESSAAWLLKDSPEMKRRFRNSVREMILRDRNHPSLTMWGILNETPDGPVFREASAVLPLVRSLDMTRLVLLSSGRFDKDLTIGSASNPGGSNWEYTWGKESPAGGTIKTRYPDYADATDFHAYPPVPQTPETKQMMRTLGQNGKPVFFSEYGIGSLMNVLHELRMYEQAAIRPDAEDFVLVRSMAERFVSDWLRFGMDVVYPCPETLLRVSQEQMARHRLLGFNLIRSNPRICGFNLTGMLDHAFTGEGIWRFWRDWKPGAFDAMQDGWAPVRWCLFVEPTHGYVGRPFTVEAVLANEDTVRPGNYPAQFRAWGPNGLAWERKAEIHIPDTKDGEDGPLAVPVLKEELILDGPEGDYHFTPYIQRGISPPETSWQFHVSDPASFPKLKGKVVTWGLPANVNAWLSEHGAAVAAFGGSVPGTRELILIGDAAGRPTQTDEWRALAERMATGSTIIFLSPSVFKRDKQDAAWLPLANKGRIYAFYDWLYHKECVAKPHAVFQGMQGNGLLDWYYYGPVLPHYLFDGQDTSAEVIAAAFATGYSTPGGYASGLLLASYKFGAGQFMINSFPIVENIDKHPAADRLLLNLIQYAAASASGPAAQLPHNFEARLKEIAYVD
jgi:hypothetical protein